MKKINQIIKNLLIFYSKTNGIVLNDEVNNKITDKNDKSNNPINNIDEISPIENKNNIKDKLIYHGKKRKKIMKITNIRSLMIIII